MQNSEILTGLRISHNLSVNALAKILNISCSTYKDYENATVPVKLEVLNSLSNYYHVSFDYLLGISKKEDYDHFRKSIDYNYLRFCVKFLRVRERITQKDLALEFNCSHRLVGIYEHDGKKINIFYLVKIAKKFNISADYLCGKSLKKAVLT